MIKNKENVKFKMQINIGLEVNIKVTKFMQIISVVVIRSHYTYL